MNLSKHNYMKLHSIMIIWSSHSSTLIKRDAPFTIVYEIPTAARHALQRRHKQAVIHKPPNCHIMSELNKIFKIYSRKQVLYN